MGTFIYPSQVELNEVAQVITPRLEAERLGFQILPTRTVDSHLVSWEQLDNFHGLQQVRGLDGRPARVKKIGAKRYNMEPGVYGEYIDLDETELTSRRRIGTINTPADVSDLVMQAQAQLIERRLNRVETMIWSLLVTGSFSIAGPNGQIIHTDSYTQVTQAGSAWSAPTTGTPIADLRAVQLLGPPVGANFGRGARAIMNRTTFNLMVANTNAADLGGRRLSGLQPANSIQGINDLLEMEDLPGIQIYDQGYVASTGDDNTGSFTRFLPDKKIVIVGQRPAGQVIGEFRYTRNANNPGMAAGPYQKVVDIGETQVPRRIDVHDGFNGGPVIYFPGSIVILTVT
jgi:hypothetical protein